MTSTLAAAHAATPGTLPTSAPTTAWDEPDGVAARGTLVVLTGRGESPAAYGRFGRRIAADAWKVRVVELDLDDLGAAGERVHELLDDLPRPHVLVGTDTGATYAAVLAQNGQHGLDGLVLAGLALPGDTQPAQQDAAHDWDGELETRSACPAHRRVISADPAFQRGALRRELPTVWDGFRPAPSGIATLVVHGSDDPLTRVDAALEAFRGQPLVQGVVVEGGRHDVLNDVSHRSVAATLVLFLERLRLGADLPIVVRDAGLT